MSRILEELLAFNIQTSMPAAVAYSAAISFVSIPPVEVLDPVFSRSFIFSSENDSTFLIKVAPGFDGFSVYSPSTSVNIKRVCAPIISPTKADRRSLSPNLSSWTTTASFSLTIGTTLSLRSSKIVFFALRY
eukprot:NODE_113_length_18482_cov_1.630746.p17 type:complete len:132 gc:universal NODE_113_length_18482_cov_1.630746:1678-1283(-)